MKIGIFGGSFNPPHNGHINSMVTVAKKSGLKKIKVIPAYQNPLKTPIEGATAEHRLTMTKLAVESYGDLFEVDDQEIKRKKPSYTIETIKNIRKEVKAEDLFLIIGLDNFENFGDWKDYQDILTEANLIVTSRPGHNLPDGKEELPEVIKPLVVEYDFNFIELKSGRSIQFVKLNDVEVSGTELRKWLRVGKSVEKYMPLSVERYIKENNVYAPLKDRIGDYKKFTEFCGASLYDKKAINVKGFDLTQMSAPTEYTLVASGTSTRHAVALAENLIRLVKEEYNVHPLSVEGVEEGRWVLVDYGSLIVHIFYDFVRQEYSLEKLWKEAKELSIKDPSVK